VTLLSLAGLLLLGGCGGAEAAHSRAALKLSREDLLAVCSALELAESQTAAEVAAAKQAWHFIADGPPRVIAPSTQRAIEAAAASAAAIRLPAPLTRIQSTSLTGPAADLAGLFRSYVLLSSRGWRLIAPALSAIQHGAHASAVFARENVALYIESVYDGHFALAQIGKKLLAGYRALGGSRAFGDSLAPARVRALARAYSEASDRLHPHVGVRLGS
jgi:hypothetical protein